MGKQKELSFFDPSTCNLCNNGIAKEIMRLMNDEGLSIRKASVQLEEDIKKAAGGVVIYSADAIRSRFKNTVGTGSKPPTPKVKTAAQKEKDALVSWFVDLKASEKNVVGIVCRVPSINLKEFRKTYVGNDNHLAPMKKKVASFFGQKKLSDLPPDHYVFTQFLKNKYMAQPKFKEGAEQSPVMETNPPQDKPPVLEKPKKRTISNVEYKFRDLTRHLLIEKGHHFKHISIAEIQILIDQLTDDLHGV